MLGQKENIVEKGENADYQHFLFFPQCFQELPLPEVLTHYQRTNFRLFQTERVCRQQFQI